MDISCSNFSRAINFGALSDGVHDSLHADDTLMQSTFHNYANPLYTGPDDSLTNTDGQSTLTGDSLSDVSQHHLGTDAFDFELIES